MIIALILSAVNVIFTILTAAIYKKESGQPPNWVKIVGIQFLGYIICRPTQCKRNKVESTEDQKENQEKESGNEEKEIQGDGQHSVAIGVGDPKQFSNNAENKEEASTWKVLAFNLNRLFSILYLVSSGISFGVFLLRIQSLV